MGLQFTWIEANLIDFFLADVENSRGKFDEIKEEFAINPAPIALQLSRNAGGSQRTYYFAPNLLNCFTNQSKVEEIRRATLSFKRGFGPEHSGRLMRSGA